MKINVDTKIVDKSGSGLGVVIKDAQDEIIASAHKFVKASLSLAMAKASSSSDAL